LLINFFSGLFSEASRNSTTVADVSTSACKNGSQQISDQLTGKSETVDGLAVSELPKS
jgi:hypothetical protein